MFAKSEPIQSYLNDTLYSNNPFTKDIWQRGGGLIEAVIAFGFMGRISVCSVFVGCENLVSKNLILTAVHKTETFQHLLNILIMRIFQSRAVTGLLTGRNTLRRHLYLLGLIDSPLCMGA